MEAQLVRGGLEPKPLRLSASSSSPTNMEPFQFDHFTATSTLEGEFPHPRSVTGEHTHTHTCTYGGRDSPTPHASDLEASLLDLLVGQLDVEVELVVAGADDDLAALLGEVGDTRVELDIAIIFESLTQMDELEGGGRETNFGKFHLCL